MRSQKLRLKLTKEQEKLAWWYSKVSRNYWNLLVDIDKRNNKGEFDDILSRNGNKAYIQIFMIERYIVSINQTTSILLRLLLLKTVRKIVNLGLGIINLVSLLFIPLLLKRL